MEGLEIPISSGPCVVGRSSQGEMPSMKHWCQKRRRTTVTLAGRPEARGRYKGFKEGGADPGEDAGGGGGGRQTWKTLKEEGHRGRGKRPDTGLGCDLLQEVP